MNLATAEHDMCRVSKSKLLAVSVALLPIFYQLAAPVPFISLGELILMPIVLYLLATYGFKNLKLDGNLALFYCIPVFLTFIAAIVPNDYYSIASSLTVFARMIFFYFLILIARDVIDFSVFIKAYFAIALVACCCLILQVGVHYLTSFELPVMRSFSSFLFSYSNSESVSPEIYYHLYGFRPAAFFTEPSYFAFYIDPLIALLLFGDDLFATWKTMRRLGAALFFTCCGLLTSSTTAAAIALVIWGYYLFASRKPVRVEILLGILFLGGTLFTVFLSCGFLDTLVARTSTGASFGPRIARGFEIYSGLDGFHKLIGIGVNNIQEYVTSNGIVTIFDEQDVGFTTDLTNRLIASGILGTLAMALFVAELFRRAETTLQKVLILITAANFLFSPWQYSYPFAFMMILILTVSGSKALKGVR